MFFQNNQFFLLITIYKQLLRPYLDYAFILYKQLNNNNFRQKFEGM